MLYHIEMRKVAFTADPIKRLLPSPHIHTHLEMIYLKKGCSVVTLDHKQYQLKAGDLFLSFPNQLHFYQDQTAVEGYMIIFLPELFPEFKEIFQTKILSDPTWKTSHIPVNVCAYLEKISQKLSSGSSIDYAAARGYLLTLLAEMFTFTKLTDKPGDHDTVKKLLSYCIDHYTEPLTLDYLAKELYLNKYYISHIFRERMNINYKDFITQLRIEHACKLLREDVSITEVSYASGFSSPKTFNRTFLKHMNMSPREYAKTVRRH